MKKMAFFAIAIATLANIFTGCNGGNDREIDNNVVSSVPIIDDIQYSDIETIVIDGKEYTTVTYYYNEEGGGLIDTLISRIDVQAEITRFLDMGYRLALQYATVRITTSEEGDSLQEVIITLDNPYDSTNGAHVVCGRVMDEPGWTLFPMELSTTDKEDEGYFRLLDHLWIKQYHSIFESKGRDRDIALTYLECVRDLAGPLCMFCSMGCAVSGPLYPACTITCCSVALLVALIACI